ncbi:MAG: hypothetical protein ACLPKI_18015 [Streptosporangiaceae bacterium]
MTIIVAVAIGLAIIVFLIFASWPLYNTYRNRGQGADVRAGETYLEAKEEYEHEQAAHEAAPPPHPPAGGGPAGREPGDTPLRPGLDTPDHGRDSH